MGFLLLFHITNESSFLSIRIIVTHRKIDSTHAEQLGNELGITYIEISAVTGINVQETLEIIIDKIFYFMNKSVEKYYQKQSLQMSSIRLSTDENYHRRKTSIKLIKKIIQC
ncbi:unnamed protein product [Rotaria sp. Silwood2]|nr:unnamed protein product [Rotaria sp. Silwood2]CAF4130886.1 unnamed protein product [Rotaria sp. Silwood2]